ncbi:MAG: ABC transporter permease [Bryobacterales bacterium]|nr:ABC transporter permease [Bryobacterales bacterium]
MKPWERIALPVAAGAVIVAIWIAAVHVSGTTVFPLPQRVLAGTQELAGKGVLGSYVRDSLMRVGAGYLLALVAGIPLGIALGWYPLAARSFNPLIQMLRPISPLAWIPISIVLFGVGDEAAVFLIFLASFFPIVTQTMNGVKEVPEMFRLAGLNFGLSAAQLFRRVLFPAALPQIVMGLRIALGIAWLVVVAAEMIAVDSGLGYLIIDARNAGKRYDLVVAGMLMIGLIGLALDTAIRRLETLRALRWGFRHE